MPIDYYIDHRRRLVVAHGKGKFTASDVFGYQREVWSQPGVAGYDELVDMTHVTEIEIPDAASVEVRKLASEAAATDPPGHVARFAIVAPDELAFGLGRMYQTYRELEPGGTKRVGVFRTLAEALLFLEIESLENRPDEDAEGSGR